MHIASTFIKDSNVGSQMPISGKFEAEASRLSCGCSLYLWPLKWNMNMYDAFDSILGP